MKKLLNRIRNKKGFTLAELLIVVAIIAVLVAIAIPIFTTQLEKSREATDLSNARALYAEVMTFAVGGETDEEKLKSSNTDAKISYSGSTYTAVLNNLKQTGDGWKTNMDGVDLGGVKYEKGNDKGWDSVKGKGSCTITVNTDTDAVTVEWGAAKSTTEP